MPSRPRYSPGHQLLDHMYVILPVMPLTGLILLFPEFAPDRLFGFDGLLPAAIPHYLTGAAIVIFMAVHVYLGTTGTTATSMFKTMINGWHEHRFSAALKFVPFIERSVK